MTVAVNACADAYDEKASPPNPQHCIALGEVLET
jgi:hypothetical protein